MDWVALWLSVELATLTMLVLLPFSLYFGRLLAYRDFKAKALAESVVMLPLVLPPTVIGYYLLVIFSSGSPIGGMWDAFFGQSLAFSFQGLLLASIIFNIPFAIQPSQRAFEAIPQEIREAGATCGMSPWRTLFKIELPLAWPGISTACILVFTHTLGEFGIVLMVGGAIPEETRTIAISIYDRVQAFDNAAAGKMSILLLAISLCALVLTYRLSGNKKF